MHLLFFFGPGFFLLFNHIFKIGFNTHFEEIATYLLLFFMVKNVFRFPKYFFFRNFI